jgi:hypothetical protein
MLRNPCNFKNFVSDKECGFYAKFFCFKILPLVIKYSITEGLSAMEVQIQKIDISICEKFWHVFYYYIRPGKINSRIYFIFSSVTLISASLQINELTSIKKCDANWYLFCQVYRSECVLKICFRFSVIQIVILHSVL